MGIRDRPTAARSPWQNGHAERLVGSIRREYLDHVIVFGEAHLRRVLKAYASYYNRDSHYPTSVHARRALRRMRQRPSLVMAFWQQADLFPL
jgi:transposase InsO family protein